jgi:glycosyltransferase involved in cell wall biosynthesis
MSQQQISVIMPAYNAETYIKEAIDSILHQTFRSFELIIIDDGSTDATLSIIQSYQDSRIKLIRFEQNKGNRVAANTGLDSATGKYIVRMDADDISVKERLQWQFEFMETHPEIGFCGGHIQLFGSDNSLWRYPTSKDELTCAFLFGTPVVQGASIIRKSVLDKFNLRYQTKGPSYAEDVDFFYRLSQHTSYGNLDKVLLQYRRHSQNITAQLSKKGIELNTPIVSKVLNGYKISFNPEQINLHLWLNARFTENIQSTDLKPIAQWKAHLLEHNKNHQIFPEPYFSSLLQQKWDRLFYFIAPKGIKFVLAYMRAQNKWESRKFLYFAKTKFKSK